MKRDPSVLLYKILTDSLLARTRQEYSGLYYVSMYILSPNGSSQSPFPYHFPPVADRDEALMLAHNTIRQAFYESSVGLNIEIARTVDTLGFVAIVGNHLRFKRHPEPRFIVYVAYMDPDTEHFTLSVLSQQNG